MKFLRWFPLLGAAMLASPVAPSSCATSRPNINVGLTYSGQYADYTAGYSSATNSFNVLVAADGKRIIPLHH